MSDPVMFAAGIVIFIIILMISVALHEAGHMYMAKAFKLDVTRFFVGFGRKTLWSKTYKGTEYGIKPIPLGGFVLIEDTVKKDEEGNDRPEIELSLLSHVAPWKRILVFVAGPAMNIILAFLILVPTFMSFPTEVQATTTVNHAYACADVEKGVTSSCEGSKAGIRDGYKIIKLDGNPVNTYDEIIAYNKDRKEVDVTYLREGKEGTARVDLSKGMMGLQMESERRAQTFSEATANTASFFQPAIQSVLDLPSKVPGTIDRIVNGTPRNVEDPTSIAGAGITYGEISSSTEIDANGKLYLFLAMSGAINLSIGLFNLLPLLPLDGGRIAIALIDTLKMSVAKIQKKKYHPLSVSAYNILAMVCLIPVFGLFALFIIADLLELIRNGTVSYGIGR